MAWERASHAEKGNSGSGKRLQDRSVSLRTVMSEWVDGERPQESLHQASGSVWIGDAVEIDGHT